MATHSSILAGEIPWTEEPGSLQSMGSQRIRHDLVAKLQYQQHQTLPYPALAANTQFSKVSFWIMETPSQIEYLTSQVSPPVSESGLSWRRGVWRCPWRGVCILPASETDVL